MQRTRTSRATSSSRRGDRTPADRPASATPAQRQPSGEGEGSKLAPGLHLVATPIGNLGDLAPRALAALREADLVVCEDTRVTGKLLRLCDALRPLTAYHEHNAARVRPQILRRLREGASVALVSDAGTPLVSDPGYKLVREAIAQGSAVLTLPGPSAALAALTVSGLPSDRFLVAGFLPGKAGPRRQAIAELGAVPATLVLFEAARRAPQTLAELAAALGPRQAALARELTKKFEEVRRGSLAELAAHYAAAGAPRGEVALVIGPPQEQGAAAADVDAALQEALGCMAPAAPAASVAAATGLAKRDVYRRALALKNAAGQGAGTAMSRAGREAWGRLAETLAAFSLRLRGYRVVARRFRTPLGEIDLIVRRGRLLAFVEVKARAGREQALEAIGPRQRERTERSAELFLALHPRYRDHDLRFDVVAVRPWRLPHHLSDAWRPG